MNGQLSTTIFLMVLSCAAGLVFAIGPKNTAIKLGLINPPPMGY